MMKIYSAFLLLAGVFEVQAGDFLISMSEVIADKHKIVYDRNYDDFCMGPVPLGVDLMFYDNKYTHYWACANGLTSFECQGSGCTTKGGKIIGWVPNALPQANNPAILTYWADVDFRNGMCKAKRADGNPTTLTSEAGRAAADAAGYDLNSVRGCSFHKLYETGDSKVNILDDYVNSQLSSSMGIDQLGNPNIFKAKRVIVQTWYEVGYYSYRSPTYQDVKPTINGIPNPNYYDENGLPRNPMRKDTGNSFQMITAFDEVHAFTVLNYKEINWLVGTASSNRAAQTGFDAGDKNNYQTIYPDSKTGTAGNQVLESATYKEFTMNLPTSGSNNGQYIFSIHSAKVCPPGEYYETREVNGVAIGCTGSSCIVPQGGIIDKALGAGNVNDVNHLELDGGVNGATISCYSSSTNEVRMLAHNKGCNMKCADGYQAIAGDFITLQCVKGSFVPSQSKCKKMGIDISATRKTPSLQPGNVNPSNTCNNAPCERIKLLENPADERKSLSFSIKLSSQPRNTVTITASTTKTTLTQLSAPLQFTTANWNIPQTAVVTSKLTSGPVADGNVDVTFTATGGDDYAKNTPVTYYLEYVDKDDGFEVSVDTSTKEKGSFNGQRHGEVLTQGQTDCTEELLPNSAVVAGHSVKGCKNADTFMIVKNNFPLSNNQEVTVSLSISDNAVWQGQVTPSSFKFTKDTLNNTAYFRVIGMADDVIDIDATFTVLFTVDDAGTLGWTEQDKSKFKPSPVAITNVDDTQNYAGISMFQGKVSGYVISPLAENNVFDVSRTYRLSEGNIQPGNKAAYDPVELKVKLSYRPSSDVRIAVTSSDPSRAVVGMEGSSNAASQIIEFKGCSSTRTPLQKAIDSGECLSNGAMWKTEQKVTIYGFNDGKDTSNKECYNNVLGCIDPSYYISVTAEPSSDILMNGSALPESSIWSQPSVILSQNTAPDQRNLKLKFTTRDSSTWIAPEELARQQAEAEAQRLRDQTALIGGIVGTLLLLIIIVIVVVLLAQKKIKDLRDERLKDETERAKMGKEADNIDIEMTLDQDEEMDFENLDDLTSQLRNVNMKLKSEVARLTEINVALASSAGVAPLSVVSSDDAGTLVEQIRNLKNANDKLKNSDGQKVERKHKKKKKAQFL